MSDEQTTDTQDADEHELSIWDITGLYCAAVKKGSYLEVICLGYTLLESQLEFLMTKTNLGNKDHPLPEEVVYRQKYLLGLAKLARNNGFISKEIYREIKAFNEARTKAIHYLAKGEIRKQEIVDVAKSISPLRLKLQDLWVTITFGPEESRP